MGLYAESYYTPSSLIHPPQNAADPKPLEQFLVVDPILGKSKLPLSANTYGFLLLSLRTEQLLSTNLKHILLLELPQVDFPPTAGAQRMGIVAEQWTNVIKMAPTAGPFPLQISHMSELILWGDPSISINTITSFFNSILERVKSM